MEEVIRGGAYSVGSGWLLVFHVGVASGAGSMCGLGFSSSGGRFGLFGLFGL